MAVLEYSLLNLLLWSTYTNTGLDTL